MTELTTLQKALYTIKKLKKSLENQIPEPIAIIGLGCRFPKNLDKNGYWEFLCEGQNSLSKIPAKRWELLKGSPEIGLRDHAHPYWGSFLENIEAFDAYFFGISPREAMRMDPQQRLLLKVAYEAIEDAGFTPETLKGSNTGVFAGLYGSQFAHLQNIDTDLDALYLPTGNATSIAANRLSYWFNFHGPSMVIDTACSASLVAAHLACLYLQHHLCELALVCGVHINLLPSINLVLSKAKMLSPDGQCKTFDADANGYVQGEGAGALVFKRLDQALRDKNRIYAVIAGSSVNQDGATNGLTAPNGLQQVALLKAAYKKANISPEQVSYVECHGTGTFLGDPIELQALGEVISQARTAENPCWIGSVKTNIGHLEPAAGIASMIKVALSLQQAKILPHLNFYTPNPHIPFDQYHFKIPLKIEDWPKYGTHRVAGISGFGFGGTNAHLVVRDLSDQEKLMSNATETPFNKTKHLWSDKIYWPILKTDAVQKNKGPLQGEKIPSPLSTLQFHFTFNTQLLPEIKDTFNILHAGYYLEMLAFAVCQLDKNIEFTVENLAFLSPLIISNSISMEVQLLLKKIENDVFIFEVHSQQKEQKDWMKNAEGKFFINSWGKKTVSISDIKQRCVVQQDEKFFYDKIASMGMPHGDSIRWTKKYWLGEKEILCEFSEPTLFNANEKFILNIHPGIIDGCIQAQFMLFPEVLKNPFVASHIEKIYYRSPPLHARFYLLASLREIHSADGQVFSDWTLINDQGEVFSECQNICMTPIGTSISIETMSQMSVEKFPISKDTTENQSQISEYLVEQLSTIFSMPKEDVHTEQSLQKIGMDSLMALSLIQIIEKTFGINYPLPTMLEGPSIAELSEDILGKIEPFTGFPRLANDAVIASAKRAATAMTAKTGGEQLQNTNLWIAYRKPQKQPKIRLFCFPYGGGGASIYQKWQSLLPNTIEVCPVQLPGRENRMNETPIHQIDQLTELLVENLKAEFSLPFALFGHSFGALIAFTLARSLRERGLTLPTHLFVSAYPAPKTPTASLDRLLKQLGEINLDLNNLKSAAFIAQLSDDRLNELFAIFSENGVADYNQHTMNRKTIKLLLPTFIADMCIVKSYQHHEEPPFDFSITAFSGIKDTWVSHQDHLEWADETTQKYAIHEFNSGHLFIREDFCRTEILRVISGGTT